MAAKPCLQQMQFNASLSAAAPPYIKVRRAEVVSELLG